MTLAVVYALTTALGLAQFLILSRPQLGFSSEVVCFAPTITTTHTKSTMAEYWKSAVSFLPF